MDGDVQMYLHLISNRFGTLFRFLLSHLCSALLLISMRMHEYSVFGQWMWLLVKII